VPAWDIRRFASIGSTNTWVLDEARAGAPAGLVAVADHQSAGRGRRGRRWEAPAGSSLLVSVLLRPALTVARAHLVSAAMACAAVTASERLTGFAPGLKWPNDLVAGERQPGERQPGERKLGGILAESLIDGGQLSAVVVGLGLNLAWESPPGEVAEVAITLEQASGRTVARDDMLAALLDALAGWLAGGWEDVAAAYRRRCTTLGRAVRVEVGDTVIEGVAEQIGDDGRLGLRAGGELRWVAVGDLTHLLDPSAHPTPHLGLPIA